MDFWNTGIGNTIIGAVLGGIISAILSLKVVEYRKAKYKKKLILSIICKELPKYPNPTPSKDGFQLPLRGQLIWNILTSDILDIKNDSQLIDCLYKMSAWIENFNYTNDYANQSSIEENNEKFDFLSEKRDSMYKGCFNESNKLLQLLKQKYKFKVK